MCVARLACRFCLSGDPRYLRYSPWTHRLRQDVERLVHDFVRWQHEQPRCRFQLALVLQTNRQVIGSCGIRMVTAYAQEAELGYELHPNHWGQGYATEAAQTMLAFAFQTLHLQRVWAQCRAKNMASVRVLERLGMRDKRHLRQRTWMYNRWWDMLVYTLDRAAWQEQTETEG